MKDMNEEIEEARSKVALCRIRAERPGSRLEDDFALEKARTRLLTLELRQLKRGQDPRQRGGSAGVRPARTDRAPMRTGVRTNHERKFGSARERAEQAFASLRRERPEEKGEV